MGMAFIIAGVILFLSGFLVRAMAKRKAAAILTWPKTRATVINSGLHNYTVGGGDASSRASVFVVEYDYSVAGQTHRGRSMPGGATISELQARYPKGATVEALYDPNKPTDSRVGFTGQAVPWAILPWVFGLTLVFIGLLMRHGENAHH